MSLLLEFQVRNNKTKIETFLFLIEVNPWISNYVPTVLLLEATLSLWYRSSLKVCFLAFEIRVRCLFRSRVENEPSQLRSWCGPRIRWSLMCGKLLLNHACANSAPTLKPCHKSLLSMQAILWLVAQAKIAWRAKRMSCEVGFNNLCGILLLKIHNLTLVWRKYSPFRITNLSKEISMMSLKKLEVEHLENAM